ncbi:TniQ family protein [Aquimarina sp. Aq78]|uniref:TniQ family protein n=1 Tax=Aquimarina sp. Aq78 TaxID=1191889 RepID=UPI000D10B63C|nr:TniQ family protein [Aquimarina sp. Aq78]
MNLYDSKYQLWPGYIPPKKDELLSSWLFRNSREHKIKPFSFILYYLNKSNLWTRDMDKWLPHDTIRQISNYTPLSKNQINSLQLTSYKNIIFEESSNYAFIEGVLNLGIYHRARKRKGLLACPGCLTKDPYFKKSWRLLSSIICLDCSCHLIDSCIKCNEPIVFQRLSIGDKNDYFELPVYLCWNCKYDLRLSYVAVSDNEKLLTEYQYYINKTIKKGYNIHSQYSFLYFKILFLILRKSCTKSETWNRVRNGMKKEFNIKHTEQYRSNQFSSLSYRKVILPLIYTLLDKWPINFIKFCKSNNIRYSDFSKDNNKLPFWFYKIFKENL